MTTGDLKNNLLESLDSHWNTVEMPRTVDSRINERGEPEYVITIYPKNIFESSLALVCTISTASLHKQNVSWAFSFNKVSGKTSTGKPKYKWKRTIPMTTAVLAKLCFFYYNWKYNNFHSRVRKGSQLLIRAHSHHIEQYTTDIVDSSSNRARIIISSERNAKFRGCMQYCEVDEQLIPQMMVLALQLLEVSYLAGIRSQYLVTNHDGSGCLCGFEYTYQRSLAVEEDAEGLFFVKKKPGFAYSLPAYQPGFYTFDDRTHDLVYRILDKDNNIVFDFPNNIGVLSKNDDTRIDIRKVNDIDGGVFFILEIFVLNQMKKDSNDTNVTLEIQLVQNVSYALTQNMEHYPAGYRYLDPLWYCEK